MQHFPTLCANVEVSEGFKMSYLIRIEKILKYMMMTIIYISCVLWIDNNTYNSSWFNVLLFIMPCIYVPLYFYNKGYYKKIRKK